jgi:hypothetical protein
MIFANVAKLLTDTPKSQMLAKLRAQSQHNEHTNAFYRNLTNTIAEEIKAATGQVLDIDAEVAAAQLGGTEAQLLVNLKYSQIFNEFASTFNLTAADYTTILFDPDANQAEDMKVFFSNINNIEKELFDEWNANFRTLGAPSKEEQKQAFTNIKNLMPKGGNEGRNALLNKRTSEDGNSLENYSLEDRFFDIKQEFAKVGINMPIDAIKYMFLVRNIDHENPANSELDKLLQHDWAKEFKEFVKTFETSVPYIDLDAFVKSLDYAIERSDDPNNSFYVRNENNDEGAVTQIQTLAKLAAVFDETAGISTFDNAEGKTIYDKIQPFYMSEEIKNFREATNPRRELLNVIRDTDLNEEERKKKAIEILREKMSDEFTNDYFAEIF